MTVQAEITTNSQTATITITITTTTNLNSNHTMNIYLRNDRLLVEMPLQSRHPVDTTKSKYRRNRIQLTRAARQCIASRHLLDPLQNSR